MNRKRGCCTTAKETKSEQLSEKRTGNCSLLLYNVTVMEHQQHEEHIAIQQGCHQLKLAICGGNEVHAEKNEFFRQVSAQLGKLDYRKLYSAYSGRHFTYHTAAFGRWQESSFFHETRTIFALPRKRKFLYTTYAAKLVIWMRPPKKLQNMTERGT